MWNKNVLDRGQIWEKSWGNLAACLVWQEEPAGYCGLSVEKEGEGRKRLSRTPDCVKPPSLTKVVVIFLQIQVLSSHCVCSLIYIPVLCIPTLTYSARSHAGFTLLQRHFLCTRVCHTFLPSLYSSNLYCLWYFSIYLNIHPPA